MVLPTLTKVTTNAEAERLERMWWLEEPEPISVNTLASMVGFQMLPAQEPDRVAIHINSYVLDLPRRWLTIVTMIACHQGHGFMSTKRQRRPINREGLRLFRFVDSLLAHLAEEAEQESNVHRAQKKKTRIPSDWMPLLVHRFMVRCIRQLGHSPREGLDLGTGPLDVSWEKGILHSGEAFFLVSNLFNRDVDLG